MKAALWPSCQKKTIAKPMSNCDKLSMQLIKMFKIKLISVKNYSMILHGIQKHKVVPDIIDTIPSDLAEVVYPKNVRVEIGRELKPLQVKDPPKIRWAANPNKLYTICLTDPDAPSNRNPILREWHHWLVGNIPGCEIDEGETLTEYIGAGPPRGSGLHRYVFLVFQQKGKIKFDEHVLGNDSADNRTNFSIRNFAHKYKLGKPVAANFFHAQWDDYVPILYTQLKLAVDYPVVLREK